MTFLFIHRVHAALHVQKTRHVSLTAEGIPAFAYTPGIQETHALKVVKLVNSWLKHTKCDFLKDRSNRAFTFLCWGHSFLQQNGKNPTQPSKIQWTIPNIAVVQYLLLPYLLSSLAANFLVLG